MGAATYTSDSMLDEFDTAIEQVELTEDAQRMHGFRERVRKLEAALARARYELASLRERGDVEIAVAQAVEFAEYVNEHAKGRMVERVQHFLSLPYSQEVAAKLRRADALLAANNQDKPTREAGSA